MKTRIHFYLLALLCAGAMAATPKGPTAGEATPEFVPQTNPCKSEVAKFEETIGFIRQHQGSAAASAVKEKLLPAKVEADLLASQGYCGLAKYLRDNKLNR
jgi:hypothetical protein